MKGGLAAEERTHHQRLSNSQKKEVSSDTEPEQRAPRKTCTGGVDFDGSAASGFLRNRSETSAAGSIRKTIQIISSGDLVRDGTGNVSTCVSRTYKYVYPQDADSGAG